jgi:hypothetical protein
VISVFTGSGRHVDGYREFVRPLLEQTGVTVLDSVDREGEWRDAAVNLALDELRPESEWVWFTEQDFRITRPIPFWHTIALAAQRSGFIGLPENYCTGDVASTATRWHPCCLFAKTALVLQTPHYFGPVPIDHFTSFGCSLETLAEPENLGILAEGTFTHMNGLSHNHSLLEREGPPGVTYRPDAFAAYLEECLMSGEVLDERWSQVAKVFVQWYGERHG